ncbi:Asparagine-rich protein (ARP protein) [Trifolium repens]|nr:Asparagine-rich protein (ARP protein) [Trifolium repens]
MSSLALSRITSIASVSWGTVKAGTLGFRNSCCKGDFNRSSATSTRLHGPNIAKEQRDGRSYNRGDMYEISHTKRNGSYVNDEARQKNEELQKERQTSSDNEAFVTVFGKEHHGYVRGMGLGPTPSQTNGSSCRPSRSTSSSTADAKIANQSSQRNRTLRR